MMLVPAQVMPQGPSTPQGGYSSVPVTPRKNKGGRKVVKRKKSPGLVLDIPPGVPFDAQPPMPRRSEVPSPTYNATSPNYSPPSPDYMPHTPDGPPPDTVADWAAESERTGGEVGGN